MKKILISAVAIVAIVLVAFVLNGFVLLALVVLLPVIVFRKRLRKDAACATRLLTMEEAVARYGDPDDSIIVDATCANEAAGCILVFKQKRRHHGRGDRQHRYALYHRPVSTCLDDQEA